jgi:hypothetical protein
MADGMREKTTNVGGVIKRIWYAMTGATQGAELASIDDTGTLKAKQFAVQTMNTTPASPTATGTTGEIRVTAEGLYIATGTNSWVGGVRSYYKTSISNSGVANAIFSNSLTSTIPQLGRLIAYDTTDVTKFCVYNLYKANANAIVQYSLVINNVLAISAVNAVGTIVLNDTSTNIKMIVTREIIAE